MRLWTQHEGFYSGVISIFSTKAHYYGLFGTNFAVPHELIPFYEAYSLEITVLKCALSFVRVQLSIAGKGLLVWLGASSSFRQVLKIWSIGHPFVFTAYQAMSSLGLVSSRYCPNVLLAKIKTRAFYPTQVTLTPVSISHEYYYLQLIIYKLE